jgi:hypothetical protein
MMWLVGILVCTRDKTTLKWAARGEPGLCGRTYRLARCARRYWALLGQPVSTYCKFWTLKQDVLAMPQRERCPLIDFAGVFLVCRVTTGETDATVVTELAG